MKKLRSLALFGCAALGVCGASTGTALAASPQALGGMYQNLVTAYAGTCVAPQSNSWGAVVYRASCDSSKGWSFIPETDFDSRGGAWYVIEWLPNEGCLVPNWTRAGSPVVVSGPCGNVSGGDYWWYAWPLSDGNYELVNGGNTSLVLDLDVASGRVQVWTAAYDANQQWG